MNSSGFSSPIPLEVQRSFDILEANDPFNSPIPQEVLLNNIQKKAPIRKRLFHEASTSHISTPEDRQRSFSTIPPLKNPRLETTVIERSTNDAPPQFNELIAQHSIYEDIINQQPIEQSHMVHSPILSDSPDMISDYSPLSSPLLTNNNYASPEFNLALPLYNSRIKKQTLSGPVISHDESLFNQPTSTPIIIQDHRTRKTTPRKKLNL